MAGLFLRCVGILVLTAAGLKTAQLIETPVLWKGLSTHHFWLAIQIELEWIAGALITTFVLPSLTAPLTLALFSIFAVVSGIEAWQGAESCGCFGDVAVNPMWVFGLDVFVVVAVSILARRSRQIMPPARSGRWLPLTLFSVIVLSGSAGLTVSSFSWRVLKSGALAERAPEAAIDRGDFLAIKPDQLLDRPLRLADFIDDGSALLQGRWAVVLFRPNCSFCHELIADFLQRGPVALRAPAGSQIALVNVAGAAQGIGALGLDSSSQAAFPFRESHLNGNYRWVVETPLVLYVADGMVVGSANYESLTESVR